MPKPELAGVVWYMDGTYTQKIPYISAKELVGEVKGANGDPNFSISVFIDPASEEIMDGLRGIENPQFSAFDINKVCFRLY